MMRKKVFDPTPFLHEETLNPTIVIQMIMGDAVSNYEIAKTLKISYHTIQNYRASRLDIAQMKWKTLRAVAPFYLALLDEEKQAVAQTPLPTHVKKIADRIDLNRLKQALATPAIASYRLAGVSGVDDEVIYRLRDGRTSATFNDLTLGVLADLSEGLEALTGEEKGEINRTHLLPPETSEAEIEKEARRQRVMARLR